MDVATLWDTAPRPRPRSNTAWRNPDCIVGTSELGPGTEALTLRYPRTCSSSSSRFGAFAVTRAATRIAATESPTGPVVGNSRAGVSIGAFLAAWLLAHKVKWLEKYHTPIVVGSAIAALQSLIQPYIHVWDGWCRCEPEIDQGAEPAGRRDGRRRSISQLNLQPTSDIPTSTSTTIRSMLAGTVASLVRRQDRAIVGIGPEFWPRFRGDLSDLAIEDAIGQSANLGVFSN